MATIPPPKINVQGHWTYHDLDALPDALKRYELWDGELVIMPAPSIRHQMIVKRFFKQLVAFDPDEQRGEYLFAPADVILAGQWVTQPNILFIRHERRDIIQLQRIHGAPDFVVEVLSPRTTQDDRIRKRNIYAAAGVGEYLLIDADGETIAQLVLVNGEYEERGTFSRGDTLASHILDGFVVDIEEIFKDLPRE
ncbi:MAG: Uma2 family endonuclease [Chloroflexi bacterium]|nr:MAG: Uma2 family endonuclease [Chloroflexota bacterium]